MITPKPFYFVRHGETDLNKQGIIMGSIDEPLNNKGFEQAQTASTLLKTINFDSIISSPRIRALQTAECIAAHSPNSILVDPNLAERIWGEAEGKLIDRTKSLFDESHTPIGAEPFKSFQIRILKAISFHLEKAEDQILLFVSHGGVFKALCLALGYSNLSSANGEPYFFRPPEKPTNPWFVCSLVDPE